MKPKEIQNDLRENMIPEKENKLKSAMRESKIKEIKKQIFIKAKNEKSRSSKPGQFFIFLQHKIFHNITIFYRAPIKKL